MDVNVAWVGVAVPGFEALQPEDAGDNGVPPRGIYFQNFPGRSAGFEDRSRRMASADFLFDFEFSNRSGVAAWRISDSKFRSRNRVFRKADVVPQHDHALVGGADDDAMAGIPGAADQQKQGEGC